MITRLILTFFILFSFLLSNRTIGASSQKRLDHITIASSGSRGPGLTPFTLAIREGYYKDEGFDADFVSMKGPVITIALAGGRLDYSTSSSGTVYAAAAGMPVKLIFVVANARPTYLFAKPTIKSLKDLKGKTIGVGSIGDSEHMNTKKVISHAGLDPEKDVIFVGIGPAMKVSSLLSGGVDATHNTIYEKVFLKKRGFSELAKVSDYAQVLTQGLGVHERKIKETPQRVKGVIRATLKGLLYVRNNRDKVIEYFMKEWEYDKDMADASYDESVVYFTKNGLVTDERIQQDIDNAKDMRINVKEGMGPAKVKDFRLLEEVIKELGLK